MAHIISQAPIRYQTDTLSTQKMGVLTSGNSAVNLLGVSSVKGITVSGVQPSGTSRRIAFYVDGKWGRLTSSGAFQAFTQNSADYANISANGNTSSELSALTDILGLTRKTFGVGIALSSNDPDNALPSCGLLFTCENSTQKLETTEYSPAYDLGDIGQVISVSADTDGTSGGSVEVSGRVLQEGTWTSWQSLEGLRGLKGSSLELRAVYKAQTVGVSYAKVNRVYMVYSDGSSIVSGVGHGELITNTEDWYMPVKKCRLTVKHAPLEGSGLRAFIALRKSPVQVLRENLGVGSGSRKTYQLTHTDGLKYDTLRLYYDGARVYTDYEFNCEAGRVTCNAPEGVIVSCDYEYGWVSEEWHELTLSSSLGYEDYDQSEYKYESAADGLSVCALKLELSTTAGTVSGERLGTATGKGQSFRLTHIVKDGAITVYSGGAVLSSKNWMLLDDPQYISVSAPAGKIITADYDWISRTPEVYEYYAVYSD